MTHPALHKNIQVKFCRPVQPAIYILVVVRRLPVIDLIFPVMEINVDLVGSIKYFLQSTAILLALQRIALS